MLDDRKKQILKALIEEYINTAEPVSSGTISKNENVNCSSATIRNEMVYLENDGFLEKPHTSAGRIPSEKGYRYYVDELLREDELTFDEIEYIQKQLETKVNEIEDLTKIATNTLSEITHYTTISIDNTSQVQFIDGIKFVLLGSKMLMAIIMTDSGLIKETIIKFEEEITEKQVQTLSVFFNNKLKGEPLEKIDRPINEYIVEEMKDSVKVIKPIIEQLKKVIYEEKQLYIEGANKSFDLPEFKSLKIAKNFVHILDTQEIMSNMLNSGIVNDINVYIGDENEEEELKDFSVITFKHKIGDKEVGTIGIIGPKRMDYSKVISVMKYISNKLNKQNKNNNDM